MLDPQKQNFLIAHLAQSAKDFQDTIAALDSTQWTTRPHPDRWTISEIAEHILIVDNRVAQASTKLAELPEEPYDEIDVERKDELILKIADDRGTRIEAPPMIRPTGNLADPTQFYPAFQEAQSRLSAIASGNADLLRGRFRDHPFLKKLDGYQWLLVCSCHRRRHLNQIEEVKTALRA